MKKLLLKLAVSGVLLGVFLWRTPLNQVWSHLRHLDIASLIAATLLAVAGWWLSAARLRCLLPEFRVGELVRATFVALFYSTVLPGQIAGDVVKAYRLGRRSTQTGHAEAATLIDRVIALLAMFCIGAVAACFAPAIPSALRLFFVAGALAIALGCTVAATAPFRHLLLERLLPPGVGRIRTFVRHFGIALHDCLRRPLRVLAVFCLALLFHALLIAIQMLLGHALHITLTWTVWAVVYAGVTLLVLVPISIAGIGLRESGYIGMLSMFGVSGAAALSLSFTVFAIALFGAAVGGVLELGEPLRAPHKMLPGETMARTDLDKHSGPE